MRSECPAATAPMVARRAVRAIVGAALLGAVAAACGADEPAVDVSRLAPGVPGSVVLASSAAAPGTSRFKKIASCADLTDDFAPVLTAEHVLTDDNIVDMGHPNPAPYSVDCVWSGPGVETEQDIIYLSVSSSGGDETRESFLDPKFELVEFAGHVAGRSPHGNVMFLARRDNWRLSGTFFLNLVSPTAEEHLGKGTASLQYWFGIGDPENLNAGTQMSLASARPVPSPDAVVQALLSLLEPDPCPNFAPWCWEPGAPSGAP